MSRSTLVIITLLLIVHLSTSAVPTPVGEISLQYSPLTKHKSGHYNSINVNVEAADSSPESLKFKEVPMMLSLYSSELVIATNCLKDKPDQESYSFDPKTNTDDSKVRSLDFGQFSVEGYDVKANTFLIDSKYWKSDKAVVLPKCPSAFIDQNNMRGAIGLGYAGTTKDEAENNKKKAFAINANKQTIIFSPDTRKEIRGEPRHQLKVSNGNWQIVGNGKFSINDDIIEAENMAILFDLNQGRMTLPRAFYSALSKKIRSLNLPTPEDADNKYDRYLTKDNIRWCPNISISIGDQTLFIEPKDYIEFFSAPKYRYAINQYEEGEDGKRNKLVFPIEDKYKKNAIILGKDFLERYYTVFDPSNGQITLYDSDDKIKAADDVEEEKKKAARLLLKASEASEAKKAQEKRYNEDQERERLRAEKSARTKWIALVVVILILVAVVGFYLWKKKQANKLSNELNGQYSVAA